MQPNRGSFVISLDFELLWGVFDVVDYKEKEQYFLNTRKVIPAVLEIFDQNKIHATWAVVGMLFHKDWAEWKYHQPGVIPGYDNTNLSAYKFGNNIATAETENFVFAPEIIRKIKHTDGQEIATHTYSHYYCLEKGQQEEQFTEDLKKAVQVAEQMNIKLKSLVFPRNQLQEKYLRICANLGIENVRSNPSAWYWKDTSAETFTTKIFRSGDAYLPLGKKTYALSELVQKREMPLEQKTSRFLRPVEKNSALRKMKLRRIREEMTKAAKNAEIYHLWWHPHNFGNKPEESLNDLRSIIAHFDHCRQEYAFQSLNMQEINDLYLRS